jgi:hypothetical protein
MNQLSRSCRTDWQGYMNLKATKGERSAFQTLEVSSKIEGFGHL